MFINGLLKEVGQAGLGVELSDGSAIGGLLFADDFVGVSIIITQTAAIALEPLTTHPDEWAEPSHK